MLMAGPGQPARDAEDVPITIALKMPEISMLLSSRRRVPGRMPRIA
ncbi:hypothetical protein [Streptomyces sp. A5-4]